jgi:hypothetical protein
MQDYDELHDFLDLIEINPSVDCEGRSFSNTAIVAVVLQVYSEDRNEGEYRDLVETLRQISERGNIAACANARQILAEAPGWLVEPPWR